MRAIVPQGAAAARPLRIGGELPAAMLSSRRRSTPLSIVRSVGTPLRLAATACVGFALVAGVVPALARGHAKPTPPAIVEPADTTLDLAMPRYDRIIVIVEENHSADAIVGSRNAPNLTALAAGFGNAGSMFAETHPSEPNYLAMIGGDTFGIRDDDAYYCGLGDVRPYCSGAKRPGYPTHDLAAPSFPEQLRAHGLNWRGYFGGLPRLGSSAVVSLPTADGPPALYAAKHDPFVNFAPLRTTSDFGRHLAPLEFLIADLNAGTLPAFSFVVPSQCEDMHGMLPGRHVPKDCSSLNQSGLVRRADRVAADLVALVRTSSYWNSAQNVAVVITWDEDDGSTSGDRGCCERGRGPGTGGGHIPTIVVTNHGPRGVTDATPYNHYSLLRTMEDAFGIHEYLGHAADRSAGVVPMTPLFRVEPAVRSNAIRPSR